MRTSLNNKHLHEVFLNLSWISKVYLYPSKPKGSKAIKALNTFTVPQRRVLGQFQFIPYKSQWAPGSEIFPFQYCKPS